VQSVRPWLDIESSQPYSLPFRAKGLEQTKATSSWFCRCGGVARPGWAIRSFDNYCGVNGTRRNRLNWLFQRLPAWKETSRPLKRRHRKVSAWGKPRSAPAA